MRDTFSAKRCPPCLVDRYLAMRIAKVPRALTAEAMIAVVDSQPRVELESLLLSLFGAAELRRIVYRLPAGDAMHAELPGGEVSPKHLVHEAVNVLERHGQIGRQFFEVLAEERPARRDEIWAVAGRIPRPMIVGSPARDAPVRPAMLSRSPRLALAGVGVALIALMMFAFWPSLSILAFPGTSGGIVLAARAGVGDGPGRIYRGLCTTLQERDAQAVRCVELPRFGIDHDDLLEAASGAGASLLAELDGDHDLHLVPVSTAAELLSELPTIDVAAAEAQQHLPGILYPLSRALAADWRFDALRAPPVSSDAVGWRLATLAWYLNVLARNQQVIPPVDVRSSMARCRQEVSLADPSCALVHYVFAQLDPTPPDARHWLEELLAHGPPDFADPIVIELAAADCLHESTRAEIALLRLATRWAHAPCQRLTLIGVATCLLTQHPQASEDLRPVAYPGEDVMAPCEADLVAAAMTERGQWNMLAGLWKQAEHDFDAAWKHGNHPVDLLNWAESLLHQRDSGLDVATPIAAALDLRYFDADAELRHLAAFLRWLATRDQADAASLLRLYGDSPVHASVLVDDAHTLASLVCARPEHVECRAYHILTQPKQPGSVDALRLVLVAGDQR
jgi:hypothetical protein